MSEMLTGPKKIVDGLTEVFRGLTQMCEGMAEQIELLEFTADDVTEEDKLIPPAKLPPVDTAPKGQEMPHPRKKPVKRPRKQDIPPVVEEQPQEPTEDEITAVIVAKIKQKRSNNEKIGQLLKTYGVGQLSELPAAKYEAFLADISQL